MATNAKNNGGTSRKPTSKDDFLAEPSAKKNKQQVPFLKNRKNRRLLGIACALIGIFLLVAFASYCSTWQQDQDKVLGANNILNFLLDKNTIILNSAGRIGAFTSHQIMFNGFGILSFCLVPLLFGWAIAFFVEKIKFNTFTYLKYCAIILLLGSPLFAFHGVPNGFSWGGLFGKSIVQFLNNFGGNIGTGFILWGSILMASFAIFNPNFSFLENWWQGIFTSKQNTESNRQPVVDKNLVKQQKEAKALALENDHYEGKEEELFIHHSFEKEEEVDPEPSYPSQPANYVEDDVEFNHSILPTAEDDHSVNLNSEVPIISNKAIDENFEMEIVQKEAEPEVVEDVHTSVENFEPYDPSLDLKNYKFPTLDLLEDRGVEALSVTKEELEMHKNQIITTLKNFGISIAKISATVGPTVTLYEIVPSDGVRISKIRNLEDDIALSLAALGIRIIAPIPGKGTIGIEVPNLKKQIVNMRTLIASEKFVNNTFQLPIAIGKKIDNENYIVDLAAMPHLLMAGATGQGKSVGLNAILVSLLYKKHPSQLKFVLVDPKKVELSIYKHIEKHFLAKLPNEDESIITDTKKVVNTLNSLCIEMDQRYDLLKEAGVRNIKEYNEKFIKRKLNPQKGHCYLPFIVLVVDEFADLMMTAGKEVEMPIARLAQLARAIGIHLIIATQRPSVNVITGTIKANFPARIAFRVSAKVDSRTILDTGGAEQLVGKGDLLISNGNELVRVQCAFVDTPEVEKIIEFIGDQQGYGSAYDLPEYVGAEGDLEMNNGKAITELDQMFEQCARLVVSSGSGSTSMLQRRFNLGYNRAGRIMDQMESVGIVTAGSGGKPRDLLVRTEMELEEMFLHLPIKGS